MSRKTLWAPWRMEYLLAERPDHCVFCSALDSDDDRDNLVLARGEHTFVMLNRYPYAGGHLMVLPRRHIAEVESLSEPESSDLWEWFVRAKQALDRALTPDGFNAGFNLGTAAGAGVADHLHLHIVPRWSGDTNFMPVLGDLRVVSQHLLDLYDTVLPHLARE